MSTKKLVMIAAAAVACVLLILAIGVLVSGINDDSHLVELPDTGDVRDNDLPGVSVGADDGLRRVAVNTDTVQDVIAALTRPVSYSHTVSAENFWDGGSAVYVIEAYVSGEASRFVISTVHNTKNIILTGGKTYIWYGTEPAVYEGGASAAGDEYQMLVTYEDILELPAEAISAAGYEQLDGKSCIYAEYTSGNLGYLTKCWISSATGLVAAAEIYDGETLVYSMSEASYTPGEPDPVRFALPDGTSAVTAPERS